MSMFGLTKKADYALIALSHLARESGGLCSVRTIARRYGMPQPILTNIMKSLVRGGLVVSERGARGGYGLAKPADQITLIELVRVIEGPLHLAQCTTRPDQDDDNGRCDIEQSCPIRLPVRRLHSRLMDFLDGVTLAELVDNHLDPLEVGATSAGF